MTDRGVFIAIRSKVRLGSVRAISAFERGQPSRRKALVTPPPNRGRIVPLALARRFDQSVGMDSRNKDGQSIGRKGAESKTRIVDAARALLAKAPSEKLTVRAVARTAGLASQTFYLYFADVEELLLFLSREASEDVDEIAAELDGDWADGSLSSHSERVVDAFYRYWDRHRAILHIRNFRADGGEEAFVEIRNASSMPLVRKIAARIRSAQGAARLSEAGALARAVIIFSAIERMAARYASLPGWRSHVSSDDLKRAEADILALLISPVASRR